MVIRHPGHHSRAWKEIRCLIEKCNLSSEEQNGEFLTTIEFLADVTTHQLGRGRRVESICALSSKSCWMKIRRDWRTVYHGGRLRRDGGDTQWERVMLVILVNR